MLNERQFPGAQGFPVDKVVMTPNSIEILLAMFATKSSSQQITLFASHSGSKIIFPK